jgi:hypothetical protein
MAPFKDFIPDGEDIGAQEKGYQDFVPPKEPVAKTPIVETAVEEKPIKKPKK